MVRIGIGISHRYLYLQSSAEKFLVRTSSRKYVCSTDTTVCKESSHPTIQCMGLMSHSQTAATVTALNQ